MKVPFISLKSAITSLMFRLGFSHEELSEPLLLEAAADCVKWFNTDQQLRHRIVLLQVENSKALLPKDYKILTQAAANVYVNNPCDCENEPEHECCKHERHNVKPRVAGTKKEQIVQWVQSTYEGDCNLEINLICPTCHKHSSQCEHSIIEVDVDGLWKSAHPEIYYNSFTRIGRFGYGTTPTSYYTPKFKLMRYSTNNFFNIQGVLSDCPNVNCADCENEFIIQHPYIQVDFPRGEVLMSYFGIVMDDLGEIMIPDHPNAHEAIFQHLRYVLYLKRADEKDDDRALQRATQARLWRDENILIAKSQLEIPDFHEWKSWLQNSSWLKRIPSWQSDSVGKFTPDRSKNYLK